MWPPRREWLRRTCRGRNPVKITASRRCGDTSKLWEASWRSARSSTDAVYASWAFEREAWSTSCLLDQARPALREEPSIEVCDVVRLVRQRGFSEALIQDCERASDLFSPPLNDVVRKLGEFAPALVIDEFASRGEPKRIQVHVQVGNDLARREGVSAGQGRAQHVEQLLRGAAARFLPFLQLTAGESGVVTVQALRQRRAHQRLQLFELG